MRFSLRTLMLLVLFAAVGSAWWRHWRYCEMQNQAYQRLAFKNRWAGRVPPGFGSLEEINEHWMMMPGVRRVFEKADYYDGLSESYRQAKWRPWMLLTLDSPPSEEDDQ